MERRVVISRMQLSYTFSELFSDEVRRHLTLVLLRFTLSIGPKMGQNKRTVSIHHCKPFALLELMEELGVLLKIPP